MIKLMLVDDETGFSSTLGERLELRGFTTCLAQTGKQAIAMFSEEKPHVVLMDLSLPDMDGLRVMERIKAIDSSVEVIIISGHGSERRGKALKTGAFSYLLKPIKLVDLINDINNAYTNRPENRTNS